MKEQFTQGDWHCKRFNKVCRSVQYVRNEHMEICTLFNGEGVNAANAHLIAAAPKMYRELQLLKMFVHSIEESIPDDGLGLAQAASSIEYLLAEARGEK